MSLLIRFDCSFRLRTCSDRTTQKQLDSKQMGQACVRLRFTGLPLPISYALSSLLSLERVEVSGLRVHHLSRFTLDLEACLRQSFDLGQS